MLNNLRLRARIFLLVMLIVGLSFAVITWIVSAKTMSVVRDHSYRLTQEMAENYSNAIRAELAGARGAAESLSTIFSTMKAHEITDRDLMNDILVQLLADKKAVSAFCVAYVPNGLDGKDAQYAGVFPYDETGRYSPYWNKLGDAIGVEPLTDIENEPWWVIPKNTKREYISDPYIYNVQGREKTMMSFFFPILDEGEFVGIIASDIVLDVLQDLLRETDMGATGGYAVIVSHSGTIVAHRDVTYVGRSLYEAIVLNDAAAHPRKYNNLSDLNEATAKQMLSPDLLSRAQDTMRAIQDGQVFTAQDDAFYTVYVPISFSEDTNPWSVAVKIPTEYVLSASNGIRNYIAGVLVFFLVILAFVLYWVAAMLTKPTLELTETARALADGQFNVEVPFTGDGSEIGTLARAFFAMSSNMGKLVKNLQDNAAALADKNASLIEAKLMADEASHAKSDFLSNMSHEMRTPLNAIIGMTAIGHGAHDIDKKDYALRKIEDASAHLLGVVNDVLDMAKIEAGKLELSDADFDFQRMLRKIVGVVTYRMEEKKQTLHLNIDKNIPARLFCDDQRLGQVIANLLSNAVKFTPEEGEIKLEAKLLGEADGVCSMEFRVTDSGIGISPEQQARLFSSFQQADSSTSRKFGGTGLGLAISKRIVELMGGQIRVESELGKGASFIFNIDAAKGTQAAPPLLAPGVNRDSLRVLAVDDDPDILAYFADTMQSFGITCDTAESGEAAAKLLKEGAKHDIYFVDWKMPGMNGIELAKLIRENRPEQAVVTMMSAMEWSVIADDAKEAGVSRFLSKPIFSSDLADCVNECLGVSANDEAAPIHQDKFPGKTILLAEDVEINREIVLALLEPSELVIECAENGEEALRMFAAAPDKYGLILMDMQMPVMDGLQATRQIRALGTPQASNLPIIAMTANVFREDVEHCLEAGMNDHLGKPLELDAVYQKLRKYLA